jgi:FkbM family methyltransferase
MPAAPFREFELVIPGPAAGVKRRMLRALRNHQHGWHLNFTVKTECDGRNVRIPIVSGAGFSNLDAREGWLYDALGRLLAMTTGTFVDVGANVGQTLIKLRLLDPERPYVGFEPSAACVAYLRRLTEINRFAATTIVPAAVSTAPGVVPLMSKGEVDPSASIVPGFRAAHRYTTTQVVASVNGDETLESVGAGTVGVIKIDVEGGELDVLQGLRQTIHRDHPFIACEILPVYDPASETGQFRIARQNTLVAFLHEAGYRMYRLHAKAPPQRLAEIEIHSELALSNYVFVPLSHEAAFDVAFAEFPRRQATGEPATAYRTSNVVISGR